MMDILERAVGPEKARDAFGAFSLPPSVSIRFNPFKWSSPKGLGSEDTATLGTLRGGTGAERTVGPRSGGSGTAIPCLEMGKSESVVIDGLAG